MDKLYEVKFKIIKKLLLLVGEQAEMLSQRGTNIREVLNLYHNLAVDYSLLTTYYLDKKETKNLEDVFKKIKITLISINPDYEIYLEKI
jgi:hypothetical protein